MEKKNKKQTSPKIATIASKLMKDKNEDVRRVAASDLAQSHNHAKPKSKKVVKKKTIIKKKKS